MSRPNGIVIPPRKVSRAHGLVNRHPGDSVVNRSTVENVIKLIRVISKAHKLSDSDLASEIGMSKATYLRIEKELYLSQKILDRIKVWALKYTAKSK